MNLELLNKTMKAIEDHPELWEQYNWSTKTDCGTAYCFMGWAARLTHPDWEEKDGYIRPADAPLTSYNDKYFVGNIARKALGIDKWIYHRIAFCENTLDELRGMVAYLNEHPEATSGELLQVFPYPEEEEDDEV